MSICKTNIFCWILTFTFYPTSYIILYIYLNSDVSRTLVGSYTQGLYWLKLGKEKSRCPS